MTWERFQRIGHGGASAIVAGNTLASFDVAVELGVDMVEFDVRECRGELVLAHTLLDARQGRSVPLRSALAHLATRRFGDVALNVDVKRTGSEAALLAELARAGLLARSLVSSQVPEVIDRVRSLEPRARVGISIGGRVARLSRRWGDWRSAALRGLASRRWDAVMAQHRVIDTDLLVAVNDRGGHLYAWTVNDRPLIEALRGLGVDGITTADPRLFAPA